MKLRLYTDEGGEVRYRKQADNGEVFGDGYRDETDALRGLVDEVSETLRAFAPAVWGQPIPLAALVVDEEAVERIARLLLEE